MEDWEKEMEKKKMIYDKETELINNEMLKPPVWLSECEQRIYTEISETIKRGIKYRLSTTDLELVWQYCQLKIVRDRAWREYSVNSERYVRIVTGICSDGKTPKVIVKENEHYKTWIDCKRQLEKILKDLRLTPDSRRR